jgi:pimeloyl-ACP methyl ester carboxylesterase
MIRVLLTAATLTLFAAPAASACETGLYQSSNGEAASVVKQPNGDFRYMFTDGRRGKIGAPDSILSCDGESIRSGGAAWSRVPLKLTETHFKSHRETLSGILIEPATPTPQPLVVMVHGSERTSPRLSYYPYILASQGLTVFAYDKRGTGASEGEYTQNFELLADDAAAALKEARRLAAGRFTRAGYFGGSQGGWVAPLAATLAPANFVAVGFGLISTPTEEDRDQVVSEMRELRYGPSDIAQAVQLADAASQIASSHFTSGFEQFQALKQEYASRPWFSRINGEYSGAMMRESDADLRRIGQAEFDNVELIWNYDAMATLRRLKAPLLWVIAEKDREAPPELTLERLAALRKQGADISVYSFPDTDHGIYEFVQAADGSRTVTRVSDGYFRLLGDWIKGQVGGPYGRARRR